MKSGSIHTLGRPIHPLEERALLAEIARALVDSPVHVRVEEQDIEDKTILKLYVRPPDRGQIIGRRGRTLTVIRQLFSAIGSRYNKQLIVEIDDSDS